jgi:hypothetical protein
MKRIALVLLFALFPTLAFGQAVNWGDYQDSNQTIYLYFGTVGTDGVAETLTSGTVEIYEDGGATQITTAETLDNDFDSVTGFHQLAVDLNDAGFETGKTYTVILTGGTVDSVSVTGRIIGVFSVGRYASATDIKSSVVGAATTEPTSPPASTATLEAKINWIFLMFRNKKTITSSQQTFYAEDASTVAGKQALTDDGTTTTIGEAAAGP